MAVITQTPTALTATGVRAVFAVPNYRRFVTGQSVSLIGSWTETIALALLVLDLTHSSLTLGFVMATRYLPVLVGTPYAGLIVERAPTRTLFSNMKMPYTEALFEAIPSLAAPPHSRRSVIPGRPPDLVAPPAGCRFAPRCDYARDRCHAEQPPLVTAPEHRRRTAPHPAPAAATDSG